MGMCVCARKREGRSVGAFKGVKSKNLQLSRQERERPNGRVGEQILQCGSLNVACCFCVCGLFFTEKKVENCSFWHENTFLKIIFEDQMKYLGICF